MAGDICELPLIPLNPPRDLDARDDDFPLARRDEEENEPDDDEEKDGEAGPELEPEAEPEETWVGVGEDDEDEFCEAPR